MLLETPPFSSTSPFPLLLGTELEKGPRARLETPFIGEPTFLASSCLRRKVFLSINHNSSETQLSFIIQKKNLCQFKKKIKKLILNA